MLRDLLIKVYYMRIKVTLKSSIYLDVDWVRSPYNRCSTSIYYVLIMGNLIFWKSKKYNVVARSSIKAEYHAMTLVTYELIWIKQLIQELKFVEIS